MLDEENNSFLVIMVVVGALLGGYVLTSVILLKHPTLIHKRKSSKFRCKHISHRGGAGENLENTIAAFDHALSVGTEMLEIDCQLTKDGEVVVSHDNNLRRLSGHDILISDTNYKDLPLLRPHLPLEFDTRYVIEGTDRKIPLLREVFEKYQDVPINVDIKIPNIELVKAVSALVKEFQREEITVWGNIKHETVLQCNKENPNIPILFSFRRVVTTCLMFWGGLLPFVPIKEGFLEIFLPPSLIRKNKDYFHNNRHIWFLLWLIDKLMINKVMFRHLEERGIQTYLWVLNEEEDWLRAEQLGVTGVMTDFPAKYSEWLQRRHGDGNEKLVKNQQRL